MDFNHPISSFVPVTLTLESCLYCCSQLSTGVPLSISNPRGYISLGGESGRNLLLGRNVIMDEKEKIVKRKITQLYTINQLLSLTLAVSLFHLA